MKEGLIVGVAIVVVGMILHLIASKFKPHDMNDHVTLAIHFFIAGFLVHILAEYMGVNKWYCANGHACVKN